MKTIYNFVMVMAVALMGMVSCTPDNDPFITATEDDYPQILQPWFGEWDNGVPGVYKTISRDVEFVDSATVTPARYTTVKWYIDGEMVQEGKNIRKTFLAGEYLMKIVATTTKGKETSRTGRLVVNPLDTDPALDASAKGRWFQIGTKKTLSGNNIENVTALYVDGQKVSDFSNNGTEITFTVPSVAEGEKKIVVEDNTGFKYGCGNANVTTEKWVEPGVETIVLYQGNESVPEWTCVDLCSTKMKELVAEGKVKAGTPLKIEFERNADDYCSIVLINEWWQGIFTGGSDTDPQGRGDITPEDGQTVLDLVITDEAIKNINNAGFFITGHGYILKKVTVEVEAAGAEKVVWEGESAKLAWNAWEDLKDSWAAAGIEAGKTITVYVNADAGAQGAITTSWWNDINTGKQWEEAGLKTDLEGECTMQYTVENTDFLTEQGFAVVGNGFVVKKVTIK